MTLRLKSVLARAGIKQGRLAESIRVPRSTLNGLINHNVLPRGADRAEIRKAITGFLQAHNVPAADWFKKEEPPCVNTAAPGSPTQEAPAGSTHEEKDMLLRKQPLTPQARTHFGLSGNPFAEPQSREEVYLSREIRYVRESMYQAARHGGFIAVVGESGAGKTTLREEFVDRVQTDDRSIVVIEPYTLAMEPSDNTGKTLRATHIAEAIMASLAPDAKQKNSPDARFRHMHQVMRDSARSGQKHVLLIEEAHCMPKPTLKHLKRFMELKDGLRPLLSIVLIAQPELMTKLSAQDPEIREVMQRLEIITLQPLDTNLQEYLEFRFKRTGVALDKVITREGLDALRAWLTPSKGNGATLLYPLAVHNALAGAMNRAAQLGIPQVNADVIRGG
ncbi:AAA family ATPase [Lysobacter yananisis]|uniref:AAA family ATPase n=1 Tax=Lysobacter yananisis TaxID=1003114 RepID=A0ABY9P8G7_9GAMM|nr:AAA family ATPase [Lysobacter yananisis]WMT03332.1 AAA family ATPase [Lysobacter yananisis]